MPATLDAPKGAPVSEMDKTKDLLQQFKENWIQSSPKKEEPKVERKPENFPKISDPVAPEPAPAPGAKKEPAKEPEKAAAEEPAKPKPAPELERKPAINQEELSESIVKGVREGVREAVRQERKAEEPKEAPLPPVELKRMERLAVLEQLYPEDYKDIAQQRENFLKAQRKYEESWIKEHPGEDFDPNASEHEEFFEKDPINKVDAEHMAEAIAEHRLKDERKAFDAKLEAVATRAEVNPAAAREGARVASSVVSGILGKAGSGLVNSDGSINQERFEALQTEDPVRAPVLAHAAQAAQKLGTEVVKLFRGAVKPDTERNPLHRQIVEFGKGVEERMLQLSPDQWEGQDQRNRKHEDFVPSAKFHRMSKTEQAKHWTFDERDFVELMALDLQNDAKKVIDEEENRIITLAKRRGYEVASAPKTPAAAPAKQQSPLITHEEKPVSPSSALQPKMAGVKGAPPAESQTLLQAWGKAWLGK